MFTARATHVTIAALSCVCSLLCVWTVTEQQRMELDDHKVLTEMKGQLTKFVTNTVQF